MDTRLRVLIADDERPARSFLAAMLRRFDDVEIVGEAGDGAEAVRLVEAVRPDLALLDLQMPELDGLAVVRAIRRDCLPLVAFVTAHDAHAITAFELNAVDYLLKPVSQARLREAINRAQERLERRELHDPAIERVRTMADGTEPAGGLAPLLERIPVRRGDTVALVPVKQVASIVADGELLRITTLRNERHAITFRLKDLEARLDPAQFIRLGRGTLANVEAIQKATAMPGGTHVVVLANGQQLSVSRIQSRELRRRLLTL